jgi:hypothetical protein
MTDWHEDSKVTDRAWMVIGRHMVGDLDGIKQLVGDDPIPLLAAMTDIAAEAMVSMYGRDASQKIITFTLLQAGQDSS